MAARPAIGAIIQARTGSTRLPGKIFKKLAGKPILEHILLRLQRCRTLDKIVIATSKNPEDSVVLDFAESQGILSFAGSEQDVQSRFIEAANVHGIDIIVRICSDSPFIDPEMIDRMVRAVLDEKADYAEPCPKHPAAQEGFEVVTLAALKKSRALSSERQHREHVTLHIRRSGRQFALLHLRPDRRLLGNFRLSVDNYADLEFVRAVYDALYRPGEIVNLKEMVNYLKSHPEIYRLNRHIRQKPTDAISLRVGFLVPPGAPCMDEHLDISIERIGRMLNEHYHCGIHVLACNDLPLDRFADLGFGAFKIGTETSEILAALAEAKIDLVISCGCFGADLTKALEANNYRIVCLIERNERIFKAVVTGKPRKNKRDYRFTH